ncbi:phage minor structural protein [[Clostridium] sordellii]|nr:phage minor structural protein [[Clostridium] sordellii] [Paeniclostridium sordellii]
MKELNIQGNSYDFFTRIIPIGKDNLRISAINGGKEYVENYQYSNKVKTIYWKDDRYTIVENLKEDAEAKLAEISKPYRSYSADIINLAKLNDKYKNILDYNLGDTITLISKDNKFRDKQRIVKINEHPDEHELDSVELANTTLSFEEIQTQFQEAADTVSNITTDNGTVDGSTIDSITTNQISDFEASVAKITDLTVVNAKIENLEAFDVNITGQLTAVQGTIGTLTSNVAKIDSLTVTHSAQINDLQANKASITQLEAVNATIQVLEANVDKIETLVNGNLSSENIQSGGITSDKLTIANGFIKNAMIASLDVSKVNAGDISTNKFRITSDSGNILISDNTIQIRDTNRVRVQIGKDAKNDYTMYVWDSKGNLMFDATGLKSSGIKEKIIRDDMISDNANIDGHKLNINSVVTQINNGSTTIKSSKVQIDEVNQTLDLAFNSLKTQTDETKKKTESNSTTIGVMQGEISTAINNTQIVKDGQTILLKDDYNRTVDTVDSMKSTIGKHTTQINSATGKIDDVETKVNTVERDLNSIKARVSSTETNVSTTKSKVASIEANLSNITSRVSNVETSQSTVNDKIISLETWKKEAAQKITDASIISTVSSQFYKKNEVDGKITESASIIKTEINQQLNQIDLVASSSKLNMLNNSNGFNNIDWWGVSNGNLSIRTCTTDSSVKKGFSFVNKSNMGIRFSQDVALEGNVDYTIQINCTEIQSNVLNGFRVTIQDRNDNVVYTSINLKSRGVYRFNFKVNSTAYYKFSLWHNGASQEYGSLIHIEDVILLKGLFKRNLDWTNSTEDTASITLKANQIVNKVSAGDVSSIIAQNPKSVEMAFNNITGNVQNSNGKFIIRNGAIELYNHQNLKCFSMDPTGWLNVWGLKVFGPQNPIQFTGDGDKGIEINANQGNLCYIDFSRNGISNDYTARIAQLPNNGSLISIIGGLEVLPDVRTSSDARLELRSPTQGPAYIDFSHGPHEDFQKRIISFNGDPQLHINGGVTIDGPRLMVDRIARNTNSATTSLYIENNIDMQGLSIYNAVIGSDRNLKYDIRYINSSFKNSCYEFVRDHLKTATFRYNINIDATTRMRIGLIAQDLYEFEIGRIIQTKNKFGQLGYDDMSYTNVLATALQKVIEKNELLEEQVKELKSKIA